MNKIEIEKLVQKQKEFFLSGETYDISFRKNALKKLKQTIIKYQSQLEDALNKDLSKSYVESFLCDIGPTIAEINENIRNLKKWSRTQTHFSGIKCFPSTVTKVYKHPYGNCLIISPFNFPVMLTFSVLAPCIAAGNTAIIKVSNKSCKTSQIMKNIVDETFDEKYVKVITGGHDVADMCLDTRFDKIFYTGSPRIGKHVLSKAANNLTPVALELGGETGNWCIVKSDADLKDAARKIAFFKACNSGQICININQIAVAKSVEQQFIEELKLAFQSQIGDALQNEEYPKLINDTAYKKCQQLANSYKNNIVYGGHGNAKTLKFEPTILRDISIDDQIVQSELFNPILPIVAFDEAHTNQLLDTISRREHALAFYIFTSNVKWAKSVMKKMQFGGGCINEVCIHIMVKGVPFNGVGHSGMGAYHGKWGFDEFSHPSTVLIGKRKFNLSLREHPYGGRTGKKYKLIKKLLK